MSRVAIIVLNWNGATDTLKCLDSLHKQYYKDYEIIVVDNGSTDNSRDLLEKYNNSRKKNIDIIYNQKNLGFSGGVNTGIKRAINENYTYIALLNNDAVADKDWLKNLLDAMSQDNNIGISTGLLLHEDGKTIDSTGDWYTNWGLPFPRNRNNDASKAPEGGFVFSASGGASLYKSEMLHNIGLFDEDFFAYYEDVDISFRAQLAGYKVVYTPKAIAYHKRGAASNKMSGFGVYQTFKNLPLLYIKNVPSGLLFSIGIRFYFAYFMMLFNAIIKGNGFSALKGAFKSFVLKFKKISERKMIQKSKKVDTSYIKDMLWNDLPPDQIGLRKLRKIFTGKK